METTYRPPNATNVRLTQETDWVAQTMLLFSRLPHDKLCEDIGCMSQWVLQGSASLEDHLYQPLRPPPQVTRGRLIARWLVEGTCFLHRISKPSFEGIPPNLYFLRRKYLCFMSSQWWLESQVGVSQPNTYYDIPISWPKWCLKDKKTPNQKKKHKIVQQVQHTDSGRKHLFVTKIVNN